MWDIQKIFKKKKKTKTKTKTKKTYGNKLVFLKLKIGRKIAKDKKDSCFHLKDGIKLTRIMTTAKKKREIKII